MIWLCTLRGVDCQKKITLNAKAAAETSSMLIALDVVGGNDTAQTYLWLASNEGMDPYSSPYV